MRRPRSGRYAAVVPLLAAAASVALVLAWVWLWHAGHGGPTVLGYAAGPLAVAAAVSACRAAAGSIALTRPVAEFWRRMGLATTWVAVGAVAAFVVVLVEPPRLEAAPGVSPWAAVPLTTGIGVAVFALLRLPLGPRTGLRWPQLLLDGATVAVAGAVLFWYVALDFAPAGLPPATELGAAVTGVGGLVAVVVIGKASVAAEGAADGSVDGTALRLLSVAPAVGVVGSVALIAAADVVRLLGAVLALPLVGLAVSAAAYRQQRAARTGRPSVPRRRGSAYDLAPYLAVGVIGALVLVVSARTLPWSQRSVVIGAVAIAVLVGVRQLVGLRDHRRLLRDVRRQQARLEHQANHDPLTGLPNRNRFGAALVDRMGARRPAAVLLIDIDDFKLVNDTLGHAVGDQFLVEVARRLREHTDAEDLPARLGGDEFAVLLGVDDLDEADAAAARVLAGLTVPIIAGDHQLLANASIGVATARAGELPDDVLRNADIAMYAAKAGGKASWARFEPRMRREILANARIGADLHDALERAEFSLAYQPVRDLATGRITGMESLIRWQHPERGTVPPLAFIPVAERTGLIVALGRWVLREACGQLAAWRAAYGAGCLDGIGVNVAARQLREPDFVADVAAALGDHGLAPADLVIEVTESSVLDGPGVQATLQALHGLGVRLALDDFGTGQSSLSLVRQFPVDVLKLDRSFVDGITDGDDRGRLAVAAAVVGLAANLGMYAVAEGIETAEQCVRLRELGFRTGQGYHLGRPAPAAEAGALLEAALAERCTAERVRTAAA